MQSTFCCFTEVNILVNNIEVIILVNNIEVIMLVNNRWNYQVYSRSIVQSMDSLSTVYVLVTKQYYS